MLDRGGQTGTLHGTSRLQRRVDGFILTEGCYPPALAIDRHDHELASLCIVLAGGYEERFGRRSRRVAPGAVIAHPPGEHHDERHDPIPTRLLTIEIEPGALRDFRPALGVFDEAWQRDIFNRTGFRLKRTGNAWTVTTVYPGGPADAAGMTEGDRIVQISGRTPRQIGDTTLRALLKGPVGTHLILTLAGPAKRHDVAIDLRDVF